MSNKGFAPRGAWTPNSATISELGPRGVEAIRAVDDLRIGDSLDVAREISGLSNGVTGYDAVMTATISANAVVLGQVSGTKGHTAALSADLTVFLPSENPPKRYTVQATVGPGSAAWAHIQQKDERQFEVRLYDPVGVAIDLSASSAIIYLATRGE